MGCALRLHGWGEFQAEDFVGHLVEIVVFELVGVDPPEPMTFFFASGLDVEFSFGAAERVVGKSGGVASLDYFGLGAWIGGEEFVEPLGALVKFDRIGAGRASRSGDYGVNVFVGKSVVCPVDSAIFNVEGQGGGDGAEAVF